eukprot:1154529-Pelagomonas_calceolata.AAC.1
MPSKLCQKANPYEMANSELAHLSGGHDHVLCFGWQWKVKVSQPTRRCGCAVQLTKTQLASQWTRFHTGKHFWIGKPSELPPAPRPSAHQLCFYSSQTS